jgi:hypothetical protein
MATFWLDDPAALELGPATLAELGGLLLEHLGYDGEVYGGPGLSIIVLGPGGGHVVVEPVLELDGERLYRARVSA